MPTSLVPLFPGLPGGPEMIVILLIVVLLFGANKLPKLARSSGQAMGEFKKGREEIEDELQDMQGSDSHNDNDDDDSFNSDNDDSFSNDSGFEQANTQDQTQQGQSQRAQNQNQRAQNQNQRSQNQNQRTQNQDQRSGQSNTGGWGTSTESGRERNRR